LGNAGRPMSIQVKKLHAALKHGAYSATAVLPGEDLAAFKELHEKVIAELVPVGPLEDVSSGANKISRHFVSRSLP
jgi:hypothetical protein